MRSERLAPPDPNRTAAHRMKGRKNAIEACGELRVGHGPPAAVSKQVIPTTRRATDRNAASRILLADNARSQARPDIITTTIAGTSVSSVRTLEKNRVRHTNQYRSS